MMVARLASVQEPITGATVRPVIGLDTVDANITLQLVVYGFFLIAIVQLIGIFGGDKSPLQVAPKSFTHFTFYNNIFQDVVLALLGFVLYLSIGAKVAAVTAEGNPLSPVVLLDAKAAYAGCASMCILTSLVYLVDLVFSLINLKMHNQ